jgi:hypothetical protein
LFENSSNFELFSKYEYIYVDPKYIFNILIMDFENIFSLWIHFSKYELFSDFENNSKFYIYKFQIINNSKI